MKPKLLSFVILIFTACLGLSACGPGQLPVPTTTPIPTLPPILNPTATPIPTVTPTPLPTPIPTLTPTPVILVIVPAIAPVVSGQGVPDAGVYDPDKPGPHPIVLLTTSGESYQDWNERLPDNWSPASMSTTELVALIGPERRVSLGSRSYSFGPDITAYRYEADLEIREARTGKTLATITFTGSEPPSFPYSAPVDLDYIEGSHIAYAALEEQICQSVLHQGCGKLLHTLEGQEPGVQRVYDQLNVSSVAFSPDGKTLASGTYNDGKIRFWNVSDGTLLRTLNALGQVCSVAFSPDGQTLATSGSWDDSVRLWQVSDGTLLNTLSPVPGDPYKAVDPESLVYSVAFSPDGQTLASGSGDFTVRLWRVVDGALLNTLSSKDQDWQGRVYSVAFSPDGKTLASGSGDMHIRLWQVSDGALLRTLSPSIDATIFDSNPSVYSVAFSPDGQILASGSSATSVLLWRVSDGTLLNALTPRGTGGFGVYSVAFSPDGQTLAVGSWDDTVHVWRISDGALLRTLNEFASMFANLVFSPNGQILALGSGNDVRLWQVH